MSHFQYGGLYFDQIDGVAMGSPLAPTLASVFVSHFENKFHEQLKELGVDFWARYVDDIFAIIKDKSKAESILNFLNNWHKNLRFTTEVGVKKKLPLKIKQILLNNDYPIKVIDDEILDFLNKK
jgi:hypothetical protein